MACSWRRRTQRFLQSLFFKVVVVVPATPLTFLSRRVFVLFNNDRTYIRGWLLHALLLQQLHSLIRYASLPFSAWPTRLSLLLCTWKKKLVPSLIICSRFAALPSHYYYAYRRITNLDRVVALSYYSWFIDHVAADRWYCGGKANRYCCTTVL